MPFWNAARKRDVAPYIALRLQPDDPKLKLRITKALTRAFKREGFKGNLKAVIGPERTFNGFEFKLDINSQRERCRRCSRDYGTLPWSAHCYVNAWDKTVQYDAAIHVEARPVKSRDLCPGCEAVLAEGTGDDLDS